MGYILRLIIANRISSVFLEFPFQVMIGCKSSVTIPLKLNCNKGWKQQRCALNTFSMEGNNINFGKIFGVLSVLKAWFIYFIQFSMLFCTSASLWSTQLHKDTNFCYFCLIFVFPTKKRHFGKILMEFGSIPAGGMYNPFFFRSAVVANHVELNQNETYSMEIITLLKEKKTLTETGSKESQSYISQFQKGRDINFFRDFYSIHVEADMNALLPLSLSIIFLLGSQLSQR